MQAINLMTGKLRQEVFWHRLMHPSNGIVQRHTSATDIAQSNKMAKLLEYTTVNRIDFDCSSVLFPQPVPQKPVQRSREPTGSQRGLIDLAKRMRLYGCPLQSSSGRRKGHIFLARTPFCFPVKDTCSLSDILASGPSCPLFSRVINPCGVCEDNPFVRAVHAP